MRDISSSAASPAEMLEQLLTERYSCRAFLPDQVDRDTIEHMLRIAQRTASWCNSQPWQVIITSGDETKRFGEVLMAEAVNDAAPQPDFPFPREYRGVYLDRRREAGFQLYNTLGIPRGDREGYHRQMLENYKFFGAPHVALITSDEALGVYGAVDCGAYVGNFMLAAQALGIACVPQAALAVYSTTIRSHFGLGEDRRVVCGISFGYGEGDHRINSYRTSRAEISDAVQFVGG